MNIFQHILEFWRQSDASYIPKPKRRYLRDVLPNETIKIQYYRINPENNPQRIGEVKCLSNDPLSKTILIELKWANFEEADTQQYEQVILSYKDKEFKHFHLLNPPKEQLVNTDIKKLLLDKKTALIEEDFEKADIIQKQIDKLIDL